MQDNFYIDCTTNTKLVKYLSGYLHIRLMRRLIKYNIPLPV